MGFKSEGLVPTWEFMNEEGELQIAVGDDVDVLLEESEDRDGRVVLSKEKADRLKIWDEISRAYKADEAVEGTIVSRVKGGLSVDIGVKAFLPGSQVDLRPVRNLEHRIGGLEKEDGTGNVSYDPENHEHMINVRYAKLDKIVERLPPAEIEGPASGDLPLVGWGGTYGTLHQASRRLREEGHAVGHLHLRYLNPLQRNVGELLSSFRTVVVAELNRGQLRSILRDRFLVEASGLNKMKGQPFKVAEVMDALRPLLEVPVPRELRV